MLGTRFWLAPFKSAPGRRSRSSGVVCASAAHPGSSFGAWAVPGLPAPSPKLPVLSSSSQRGCRSLGFGAALQPGACRSPREQVCPGAGVLPPPSSSSSSSSSSWAGTLLGHPTLLSVPPGFAGSACSPACKCRPRSARSAACPSTPRRWRRLPAWRNSFRPTRLPAEAAARR